MHVQKKINKIETSLQVSVFRVKSKKCQQAEKNTQKNPIICGANYAPKKKK